jgi:IS605 OrfB family transposase
MVVFTVELNKCCLRFFTDIGKQYLHVIKYGFGENMLPIFCNEDQMNVNVKNTMPSASYVGIHTYRPNIKTCYTSIMKTIRKAFKYRLNTDQAQSAKLADYAGACRSAWNKALAMNLYRLENKQPILWYEELNWFANLWKSSEEYLYLKALPSQALQQCLKNLDRAFKDGFDKKQPLKRIPTFKKKGVSTDSIRYPQGFKIEQANNRICLPKLGWISYRNSRKIVGEPKNVTVSRKGQHWYVSIQTEYETQNTYHKSTSIVGIDVGIKRFATLSDGTHYKPLDSFKRLSSKLAKLQRQLKNKVKFSNNWKKLKAKITALHERIANARHDYLHKVSTEISKSHAVIVVEDLKIRSMSKSAKGSKDKPGRMVKQKAGLNKAILDQGWGMFVDFLEYKQSWNGGMVLKVNPKHTSQECPACSHTHKDNRKEQAVFECVECGYQNHADVVGATNIKTRGQRELACEVNGAVMPSAAGTDLKVAA